MAMRNTLGLVLERKSSVEGDDEVGLVLEASRREEKYGELLASRSR